MSRFVARGPAIAVGPPARDRRHSFLTQPPSPLEQSHDKQDRAMSRTTKMTGRGSPDKAISAGTLLPQPEQRRRGHDTSLPWEEPLDTAFVEVEDEREAVEEETEEAAPAAVEGSEAEDNHGADDALGLYL